MATIPVMQSSSASKFNYDLLPDGEYEARIVRFVGLGVHKQDPWKDPKTGEVKTKQPGFKASLTFELIGVKTSGTDAEGKPLDPKPASQFKDFVINPRAKNSGMLDLVKMIDPSITALKADLDWYKDVLLGQPVNLVVSHYVKKDGTAKNKVSSITPIPTKYRAAVGAAETPLVFFEPYSDNDEMAQAYNLIYPYQRRMLEEAEDVKHIPYAGREVTKGSDEAPKEGKPTVETVDKEPSVDYDDDAPFAPIGLQEGRRYLHCI